MFYQISIFFYKFTDTFVEIFAAAIAWLVENLLLYVGEFVSNSYVCSL